MLFDRRREIRELGQLPQLAISARMQMIYSVASVLRLYGNCAKQLRA